MAVKTTQGLHETYDRENDPAKSGSPRAFGFVFAAVFTIIGVFPLFSGRPLRFWSLPLAAVFLLLALVAPATLAPLNRAWLAFGALLHRIVSPIIMAILFYGMFTPIGALLRIAGKDPLVLKRPEDADTYWKLRVPAGPEPETMPRQF